MRSRILLASTLALTLLVLTHPAWAWSNGGYSADLNNPEYGTHDWIAERALDWLPGNERTLILTYRKAYLYGTELPDNSDAPGGDGIGDSICCHHFYFWSNETVQDDIAGRKATDMQNRALANLTAGDYAGAAKWTGAMTHYIDDVALFAHVIGNKTNWGEETHHEDYEDHVETLTSSPNATLIPLIFDGFLAATSAYNATLALAYDTTFDNSGARLNAVWMDRHYNWSDPVFGDRAYSCINLAVNLVAEAVHAIWSSAVVTTTTTRTTQQTTTSTTQVQSTTTTTTQQQTATTSAQQHTTTWTSQQLTTATQTTPVQTFGVGFAFAAVGIGAAAAALGVGLAVAMSGSEVYVYGGYYYCGRHRVPAWSVAGRPWCPIEGRYLRT